jgi:NADPH:quinone reductase-like Zn-dependent oxidoreductase/SAM-dependent methyltransferase
MYENQKVPGLVQPTVLDASLQLLITLASSGASQPTPTNVPYGLFDGWVSASGWDNPGYFSLRCLAKAKTKPRNLGLDGSVQAMTDSGELLYEFKRVVMKPISSNRDARREDEKKTLYSIDWNPQLKHLTGQQLHELCHADRFPHDEGRLQLACVRLELALRQVIRNTIKWASGTDTSMVKMPFHDYVSWMARLSNQGSTPGIIEPDDGDLDLLFEEVIGLNPIFYVFSDIAANLKMILSGEIDPSELLQRHNWPDVLRKNAIEALYDERIQALIQLISHEHANLRIIEIGNADVSCANYTLSILHDLERQTGSRRYVEYVYITKSEESMEGLKGSFTESTERVSFRKLDLNRPIAAQGFDLEAFDVIFASDPLHATLSLDNAIRSMRSLLKPGGYLVNFEMIASCSIFINFTLGLLPDWWRNMDKCRRPSVVSEEKWDEVLRNNGFSGTDLIIRDRKCDTFHIYSLIFSKAVEPINPAVVSSATLMVLVDAESKYQLALAEILKSNLLASSAYEPHIVSLDELHELPLPNFDLVVSLLETDCSVLATLSEATFDLVHNLIKDTQKLLWVVTASLDDDAYPRRFLMEGLFRSLRSENSQKQFITLAIELQPEENGVDNCVSHVVAIIQTSLYSKSQESEYIVRDGKLLTGRLKQEINLAHKVQSFASARTVHEPWLPGPPLKLEVGTPGLLDSIQFIEDDAVARDLGPREVEIEAKIWGVAFRDIFIALGRLEGDDMGVDCAGVVTRVGSDCDPTTVRPGDRVCMLSNGCMRSYPRARVESIAKIPQTVTLEAAASILNPGTTAYHCLLNVARLQQGETILIHSASGSTGQAAVWIAKSVGAEIFATVGYEEKKQILKDEFLIPEDHIFYSRNTDFAQGILRMTNGRGVDVVLNSLSGDGLLASLDCIAAFGRFIEIGKTDIGANSPLPMASLAKNVSFCVVDLFHLAQADPKTSGNLAKTVMELLARKVIHHPAPLHLYRVSEVEDAFRYLQSGRNVGRILITIQPADTVKVSDTPLAAAAVFAIHENILF